MVNKEQVTEAPVTQAVDKTEYWYGTGRRKTSIARVRLSLGKGEITVNDKPIEHYFAGTSSRIAYESPLKAVGRLGDVSASVKVLGGGSNSQLEAYVHGLSRALVELDPTLRPTLSRAGLLRRDPRMKESLHFGLMGARKAKQSPKR